MHYGYDNYPYCLTTKKDEKNEEKNDYWMPIIRHDSC